MEKEKEDLRIMIEELKADNQPYQDELAFVKKVQRCADIARRDREMPVNRYFRAFRRKKRNAGAGIETEIFYSWQTGGEPETD